MISVLEPINIRVLEEVGARSGKIVLDIPGQGVTERWEAGVGEVASYETK